MRIPFLSAKHKSDLLLRITERCRLFIGKVKNLRFRKVKFVHTHTASSLITARWPLTQNGNECFLLSIELAGLSLRASVLSYSIGWVGCRKPHSALPPVSLFPRAACLPTFTAMCICGHLCTTHMHSFQTNPSNSHLEPD